LPDSTTKDLTHERYDRLALGESSVIELDRQANELLDVFVNGTLIGRGEVVTVGDRFGVRMTELVAPDKSAARN
jgi:flagellar motor switch protein FliN/FliY